MTLSVTLSELLDPDVQRARTQLIAAMGHDPALHPHFWEAWVATVTTGAVTPHKHAFDISLMCWRELQIEVKFSRGFLISFDNGRRRCFKWLMTQPQMKRAVRPDAVLLIGIDDGRVWMWCCSPNEVGRSITVTVPNVRLGSPKGSPFDKHLVPPLDLLPAILRVCHLTYDAKEHAKNARVTRFVKQGQDDLFIVRAA
ncbi:hypothetical protein BH09PSE1_BH09PSE1_23380 [soil metagenome]